MKKVLATAGALLLAGTMVSSVLAAEAKKVEPGVSMSGDARVRYRYRDNYGQSDSARDQWDSRIRWVTKAVAKGGSYAEARLRVDASPWQGTIADTSYDNGIADAGTGINNVWADYYFLHVPFADSGWSFRGGVQNVGFTPFLSDDERVTRANIDYNAGSLMMKFIMDLKNDDRNDTWGNNDFRSYAFNAQHKTDSMLIKGQIRMNVDERDTVSSSTTTDYTVAATDGTLIPVSVTTVTTEPGPDNSGLIGDIHTNFKLSDTSNLTVELAYKEAEVMRGSRTTFDDDGIGAFAQYSMTFGGTTLSPLVGYTDGGFLADETFGFIMLGGDEPIMVARVGNNAGSSWFGGVPVSFKASDRVTLVGNLAYIDMDNDVATGNLESAMELSGSFDYMITEGANFTIKAGYLDPDFARGNDDGIFGAYGRFEIKF